MYTIRLDNIEYQMRIKQKNLRKTVMIRKEVSDSKQETTMLNLYV